MDFLPEVDPAYMDWDIMFELEVDLDLVPAHKSDEEAPKLGCKVLGVDEPKAKMWAFASR